MPAVPTIEEEDAKRPNREREKLVGERTRIVNRIKSCLSRLGIRDFNPKWANRQTKEGRPSGVQAHCDRHIEACLHGSWRRPTGVAGIMQRAAKNSAAIVLQQTGTNPRLSCKRAVALIIGDER
jgi:hypothetical protein